MTDDSKPFDLQVRVIKSPTNEVEDDSWFDPEDFVEFLKERYTVARGDLPLDAYNKNAGQQVIEVEVK